MSGTTFCTGSEDAGAVCLTGKAPPTNKEELVGNVVVEDNFGGTDQETVEFKILRNMRKPNNKVRRVGRMTRATALKDQGTQETGCPSAAVS